MASEEEHFSYQQPGNQPKLRPSKCKDFPDKELAVGGRRSGFDALARHCIIYKDKDICSTRGLTMGLHIRTLVSKPFEENCYVVWLPDRYDALVIDPGLESDLILNCLHEEGLDAVAILNTHGHADHIAGNADLKRAFPKAPLLIGANEVALLTDPVANLSEPFGMPLISPSADRLVNEGEVVEAAGISLEVRAIPGHSPGHVVFLYRDQPCVVFGGDVLFRGSIGRFDFPNGDGPLLLKGIREKLFTLPADTLVFPGHGPVTTVGQEKQHNPFFQEP